MLKKEGRGGEWRERRREGTYLGVLNRESVETTAGKFTFRTFEPVSVSRSTCSALLSSMERKGGREEGREGGSGTYLGVFNRKSVETTAGKFTFSTSEPVSVSRSTCNALLSSTGVTPAANVA